MKKDYWKILREDIFSCKPLVSLLILVTVLCFGFTATNFSIGVDDPSRNYYLYTSNLGSMIQQGRLMHVAVNYLTRSVQFIPFFTEFTGAVLYALSALMYCALFQYITGGKLRTASLVCFSCVYVSNPILVEKFIYHLDVISIMLSYCLGVLALLYAYRFVKEKRFPLFIPACLCLIGALSSYESFLFLYFCGVFAVFILEILVNREEKRFCALLSEGLKYAAVLLVATALYYLLVELLQILTHQNGIFTRYSYWSDSQTGPVATFVYITRNLADYLVTSLRSRYLPILVFCFFSTLGFPLFGFLSLRKKNISLLLCYFGLWFGNFLIHYASGDFALRTAQTLCFFVAFLVVILIEVFADCILFKRAILAASVLLVFVQSADMNRWFYNDYIRYQKEVFVINTVATRLVAECDVSKSVVFTGTPDLAYLNTDQYSGRQVNGNSVIYWSINAFEDPNQPFVAELFRMHGYDFIQSPDPSQYALANEKAQDMPPWPQQGCIQEFDDFIVVNFG